MIETALVELLEDHAPVYPAVLTQEPALPAIVYQRISTRRMHTHEGPVGLVAVRFQVSAWALSYPAAKTLTESIRLTIDGFKGTVNDVRIDGIYSAGELDDYDPDPKRFRVISDYIVWHAENLEES